MTGVYYIGVITYTSLKIAVMSMKKLYTMNKQEHDKQSHSDRFVQIASFEIHSAKLWYNVFATVLLTEKFATVPATKRS